MRPSRSAREHLLRSARGLCPVSGAGADPADDLQQMPMLAGEVPLVDWLVVRDAISQCVKAPHSTSHVGANLTGIVASGMPRKDSGEAWHPHRRVIRGFAQEAPEPEVQLGDNSAVHLATLPTAGGALASPMDIGSSSRGTPTGEQMRLPVPRGAPRFGCAMSGERLVNSVAEHHFEPSEVFVQGCCRPEVPVVERDS